MAALIYNSVHVAESETDDFQERFDTSVRVVLLIQVSLWYIVFCLSYIVSQDIIRYITTTRLFSRSGCGNPLARVCECSYLRVVTAHLPQRPLGEPEKTSANHFGETCLFQERLLPNQQRLYWPAILYPPRHIS